MAYPTDKFVTAEILEKLEQTLADTPQSAEGD